MAITIQTIIQIPMIAPGRYPASNIAIVEVWDKKAQITKLMDGGIMGPIPAEAAVTAIEKFLS